jgi:hypothetical protein
MASPETQSPRGNPRLWYNRRHRRIVLIATPCCAAFARSLNPASDIRNAESTVSCDLK